MNDQARAVVLGWQRAVNAAWEQQAGLLAPARQDSISRGLTRHEIAAARLVFGDELDVSQIRLTEGGLLGIGGYARTLPNLVTFPEGTLSNPKDGFDHWLIHELTHVLQYQRGFRVIDLLPDAIAGDYYYGEEQGLRDARANGETFEDFNFEEQADILADYYVRVRHGQDTTAYDPYVNDVRSGEPQPGWSLPRMVR